MHIATAQVGSIIVPTDLRLTAGDSVSLEGIARLNSQISSGFDENRYEGLGFYEYGLVATGPKIVTKSVTRWREGIGKVLVSEDVPEWTVTRKSSKRSVVLYLAFEAMYFRLPTWDESWIALNAETLPIDDLLKIKNIPPPDPILRVNELELSTAPIPVDFSHEWPVMSNPFMAEP